MRNLKLVQVIEILFGVYDDQLAAMGDQLDRLEQERHDLAAEITSLETFLAENDVPGRLELDARSAAELKQRLVDARTRLDALSAQMQAATTYAADARAEYGERGGAAGSQQRAFAIVKRCFAASFRFAASTPRTSASSCSSRKRSSCSTRSACASARHACRSCRARRDPSRRNLLALPPAHSGPRRSLSTSQPSAPRSARALQSIDRYIEDVEKQLGEAQAAYEQRHRRRDCGPEAGSTARWARICRRSSPQRDELVRELESDRGRRSARWRSRCAGAMAWIAATPTRARWTSGLSSCANDPGAPQQPA